MADDFVVVIDVAGTQTFVSASSRLREIVGASQLVREVCGAHAVRSEVTVLSSNTNVIVATSPTRSGATSFVQEVSRQAVSGAPGIVLRAGIAAGFADDQGAAVAECFRQLSAPTLARDQPSERAWFRTCASGSGIAAHRFLLGADPAEERYLGATAALKFEAAARARERWADEFGSTFDISLEALDSYLEGTGWVAVVHFDLNGLGLALRHVLDRAEDYVAAYRSFSQYVYETVTGSLVRAVADLGLESGRESNAVVPLVLAGDDVTVVCPAGVALDLVDGVFAHLASLQRERPQGTPFLGAAAGIAVVRRGHPMHHALELAHDLTDSSKQVRIHCDDVWHHSLDVEVVHDSVLGPLSDIRARRTDGGGRHLFGGPYVAATGHDDGLSPEWVRTHHIETLRGWCEALRRGSTISSAAAHRLRELSSQSLDAAAAEYELVRMAGPAFFRGSRGAGDGTAMLDALALAGVTR